MEFKGPSVVRLTALAAAGLVVLNPASTLALGLGAIDLRSALNQPLQADIELLSVPAHEVEDIRVRLADSANFERAGMERPYLLSKLKFQTAVRPDGTPYIKVTSREPIREPFLDFLIEVDWPSGRMVREYALLLDPPVSAPAAAPAVQRPTFAAGVATGGAAPRASISWGDSPAVTTNTSYAAPGPVGGQDAYGEGTYGPTTRKDTLWSVAKIMRPDPGISLSQMMLALLQANPQAFNENNINTLKEGQILRLPDAELLDAMGRSEAEREFQRQMGQWQDQRLATARSAGPVPVAGRLAGIAPPAVSDSASGRLTLVAGDAAPAREGAKQQAEPDSAMAGEALSDGAVTVESAEVAGLTEQLAAITEEADSAKLENQALLNRLTSLEGQIASLRRLITLKDQAMADFQARLARDGIGETPLATLEPFVAPGVDTVLGTLNSAEEVAALDPDLAEEEAAELGPVESTDMLAASVGDELAEEQTQAIAEPFDTLAQATSPIEAPLTEPLAEATEPLAEAAEPLAEAAEPLAEAAEPLAEAAEALPEPVAIESEPALQASVEPPVVAFTDSEPQAQPDTVVLTSERVYEVPPVSESSGMLATLKGVFSGLMVDNTYTRSVLGGIAAIFLLLVTVMVRRRRKGGDDGVQVIEDHPEVQTVVATEQEASVVGGSLLAEEVDPLTEADVYMAYGRYDQAAEMVEKGLARDASDPGLMLKKLEILYAMEDVAGFQGYSQQVQSSLSTADPAGWREVVSMGQRLCPQDPQFASPSEGQEGRTLRLDTDAVRQAVAAHEASQADESGIDLGELQASVPDIDLSGDAGHTETEEDYALEFDLGIAEQGADLADAAQRSTQDNGEVNDDQDPGFDFDFDLETVGTEQTAEADDMSLDFELDEETRAKTDSATDTGTLKLEQPNPEPQEDLDGIEALDFEFDMEGPDLGDSKQTVAEGGDVEQDAEMLVNLNEEIDTKFELARAYMDLGDGDGAREILNEILAEGADGQKDEARTLMDKIS